MTKISIVITGPRYKEYSIDYTVNILRRSFPDSEIILATNDKSLLRTLNDEIKIDKIIAIEDTGELPSLKFPANEKIITNNNINKQRVCCLKGIEAASHKLVLRLRTDQILLDNSIVDLWKLLEEVPKPTKKKGRIITSSIFSINPRYSERMPYHISDMLQFGYRSDLIDYFSAPLFPFEYATWYERHQHLASSNKFEKSFRAKYAVEQWLTLHYIFREECHFPINFHNHCNDTIIKDFENTFIDYFTVAHPEDISLRASKFISAASYYNTQCYSTRESLQLLSDKYSLSNTLLENYHAKGMNKKYFDIMRPIIYSPPMQFIIKHMSQECKNTIKNFLTKLSQ